MYKYGSETELGETRHNDRKRWSHASTLDLGIRRSPLS